MKNAVKTRKGRFWHFYAGLSHRENLDKAESAEIRGKSCFFLLYLRTSVNRKTIEMKKE